MKQVAQSKAETAELLTFASEGFDNEEYARTARSARLQEVRLVESFYKVKPILFLQAEAENLATRQGFSGAMDGHHIEVDEGIVIGGYTWEAEVKIERKKALAIKAKYMVLYSGLENCKTEYIRLYFQKLARFTTYPFFRAHFAVQTSSSSLNLPPLPSLIERMD